MRKKIILLAFLFTSAGCFAQPKAGIPQKLVQGDEGFMCPAWSPDSKTLAFTGDNYRGIWVAKVDGSELTKITDDAGAGYKMAWNGNGEEILSRTNVYRNQKTYHAIKTFNVKTCEERTLVPETRDLGIATWRSTDAIAVQKGRQGIAVKRGKAGNSTLSVYETMVSDPFHALLQIPELKEWADKPVINPALSTDKNMVAFQIPGKGVYICDINGANVKYLGKGSCPTWTSGNKYVIVARVRDNGETFTSSELYAINTKTAETTVFFNDNAMLPMTPAVSPDGKKLAFENCNDGCIYTIDITY